MKKPVVSMLLGKSWVSSTELLQTQIDDMYSRCPSLEMEIKYMNLAFLEPSISV